MCGRQAWQKLGAMPPEEAMQKYIDIVSELYPSWLDGSALVRIFVFPACCFLVLPVHILILYWMFFFPTHSWFFDSCISRRAEVEKVMH